MNNFLFDSLDLIFSSFWISLFAFLFFLFILYLLSKKIPINSELRFKFLSILSGISLFIFLLIPGLLNPLYFGLGFADYLIVMEGSGKWLVLKDILFYGSSDDIPTEIGRLHVLNLETKKKTYRTLMGENSQLLKQYEDKFLFSGNRQFTLLDLEGSTNLKLYSAASISKLYPFETQAGIERLDYDNESEMIQVSVKDGRKYFLNPVNPDILQKEKQNIVKKKSLCEVQSDTIYKNQNTIFKLYGKDFQDKLKQIADADSVRLPDVYFLDGKIILASCEINRIIILSYKTTDKTEFYLDGFNFEFTPLWKIKSTDLTPSDFFSRNSTFGNGTLRGNEYLFTVGGFLFGIDIYTGELIRKIRF